MTIAYRRTSDAHTDLKSKGPLDPSMSIVVEMRDLDEYIPFSDRVDGSG